MPEQPLYGTPLHGGFEQPASLLHHPMEVKREKKKAINKSYTEYIQGAEEEEKRYHTTPSETQVHTPPKAVSCQSIHSDNHAAPYISSDAEPCVLTTLQQRSREVQVVPRPFGASCKELPALAYSQTTRCTCIHSSLASGEVPGSPLAKFITVSVSAIASSAGPMFSGRKEIVNSLAFVLDKRFGLHFATAHNSRPLLIPLRLYWCATQSQNTISLRSPALFSFNVVPSSNLRRSHRFLQHKQKWRTT